MIKIYGMPSCPDCSFVERQAEGRAGYEFIDIGSHVKFLKEFLRLRDGSPVFDDARRHGRAGIPCFVLEDGRVTLVPEEAGLKSRPEGFASGGASGCGSGDGSDSSADLQSANIGSNVHSPADLQSPALSDLQSDRAVSVGLQSGSSCSLDGKGC